MSSISSPPAPAMHARSVTAQRTDQAEEVAHSPADAAGTDAKAHDLAGGDLAGAKDAPSVQMRATNFGGMDTQAVRSLPLMKQPLIAAENISAIPTPA